VTELRRGERAQFFHISILVLGHGGEPMRSKWDWAP
jgi:hypothetical protein